MLLRQLKKNNPKFGKLQLLEAHKSLVDQSNERILAKIEELKFQREKQAIDEQEKLLEDQTKALVALKKLKSDRLRSGFNLTMEFIYFNYFSGNKRTIVRLKEHHYCWNYKTKLIKNKNQKNFYYPHPQNLPHLY